MVIPVNVADPAAAAPARREVFGAPRVVLAISKNLLQQCTADQKAAPLAPEANPLAAILGIARSAFGAATAVALEAASADEQVREHLRSLKPATACGIVPIPPPSTNPAAASIEAAIARIGNAVDNARVELAMYGRRSQPTAAGVRPLSQIAVEIRALARCRRLHFDGSADYVCTTAADFSGAAHQVSGDIDAHLALDPPLALDEEAAELAGLKKLLGSYPVDGTSEPWFENAQARADCLLGLHEALAATRAGYVAVRDDFRKFRAAIEANLAAGPGASNVELDLRPIPNAVVTAAVHCVNGFTQQATVVSASNDDDQPVPDVPVIVTFRSAPRVSVSAGVLVSTQDRVQLTTQSRKTGVDATTGVDTTATAIVATNQAPAQVAPFSFLNLRLWSTAIRHVDTGLVATGGIGVNRNSGSTQVEYFLGGGIAIRSLVLLGGVHYVRVPSLDGGFALGQLVPSSTTVPIQYQYQSAKAFAISYKIPLP